VVDPVPGDNTATDTTTIVESALLGEGPPDTATFSPMISDSPLARLHAALLAAVAAVAGWLSLLAKGRARRSPQTSLVRPRRRR
jgi:hypothetical protein